MFCRTPRAYQSNHRLSGNFQNIYPAKAPMNKPKMISISVFCGNFIYDFVNYPISDPRVYSSLFLDFLRQRQRVGTPLQDAYFDTSL
jgi:hypothetical protein